MTKFFILFRIYKNPGFGEFLTYFNILSKAKKLVVHFSRNS